LYGLTKATASREKPMNSRVLPIGADSRSENFATQAEQGPGRGLDELADQEQAVRSCRALITGVRRKDADGDQIAEEQQQDDRAHIERPGHHRAAAPCRRRAVARRHRHRLAGSPGVSISIAVMAEGMGFLSQSSVA
jgi:hypothetical protein